MKIIFYLYQTQIENTNITKNNGVQQFCYFKKSNENKNNCFTFVQAKTKTVTQAYLLVPSFWYNIAFNQKQRLVNF